MSRTHRRATTPDTGSTATQAPPAQETQPRGNAATYEEVVREIDEAHPDTPATGGSAGRRESGRIRVHADGVEAQGGNEEFDEGGATTSSQTMSGRVRRNSFQAGYSQTSGAREARRGGGGSGTIEFGDGRSGGSGTLSVQHGPRTFTAQGGRSIRVDPPEQTSGGAWQVSGTVTTSGGGGASTQRGATFGVTGSRNRTQTFTEVFRGEESREEAFAFYQDPTRAAARTRMTRSFDDALALEEGEARGIATGWEAGGSASHTALGVALAAGVQTGHSEGVHVERIDGRTLKVTLSYADPTRGNAGASAGGTGMGYELGREVRRTTTWHLFTEHDGARAAFEQLQAGRPLQGETGPGWERVSDQVTDIETSGATAEMFGIDLDGAEQEERTVRTDQDGTTTTRRWRSDQTGVSTTAFTRTEGEREDGYTLTHTVTRDDLDLSEEALADASNGMDGHATGEGEGTWTVESDYTEAQIDAFRTGVLESSRPPDSLPPRLHEDWRTLQRELRGSGDHDAAIGRFLQVAGVDGARQVQALSGGPRAQHVAMSGEGGADPNFPGRAANEATEAQVGRLEGRVAHIDLGGDVPSAITAVADQAGTLRTRLRRRLNAITARGAYADLPATLVNVEARRLEGWIARLDRVAARGRSREPEQEEAPDREEAERLLSELETEYETLERRRDDANLMWEQHHTAHGSSSQTPEQRFTGAMVWLAGNAMNEGYETLDRRLRGAEGQFSHGQALYEGVCDRLMSVNSVSDELREQARRALGFLRLARRSFEHVDERLRVMRDRQIARYPAVWGV